MEHILDPVIVVVVVISSGCSMGLCCVRGRPRWSRSAIIVVIVVVIINQIQRFNILPPPISSMCGWRKRHGGGGGGGGGRCTPLLIAVLNGFLDNITVKLPLSANGPLSVTGLIFCHVTKINFFPILVFDLNLQLLKLKSAKGRDHRSP